MAGEAEPGPRSTRRLILAATALLLILATAAAIPMTPEANQEEELVSRLIVGDLRLADDDEGPSDGVRATFHATNLAPGDRTTDRLLLIADPPRLAGQPSGTGPLLPAYLSLAFHPDRGPPVAPLAHALVVERLSYGTWDLAERVAAVCPAPVTLATLLGCPEARDALSDLPSPGAQGKDLVLGLRMDPAASTAVQGTGVGFTVEAVLEAGLRPEPGQGPLVLCVDLDGDQALLPYVEEVHVPVTCEVVF